MKKIILCFFLTLYSILSLNSQTLTDFSKTLSHKITYDESFEPTLHLTIKNVANKRVTSVEVFISYQQIDTDWDAPYVTKIAHIRINPGEYGTVNIKTNGEIRGHKPSSFRIARIRYEDGTICDKW